MYAESILLCILMLLEYKRLERTFGNVSFYYQFHNTQKFATASNTIKSSIDDLLNFCWLFKSISSKGSVYSKYRITFKHVLGGI